MTVITNALRSTGISFKNQFVNGWNVCYKHLEKNWTSTSIEIVYTMSVFIRIDYYILTGI